VRYSVKSLLPALVASLLVAACGSSSSKSSSTSSQAATSSSSSSGAGVTVKTASNSKLGATVLVNAQGITLYALSGEHAGKFICTSTACLHVWHPLTVSSGAKPSGSVGSLAVVNRPNGVLQVTYKGMPLYTFASDTAPGDAAGQGIKDVGTWGAVKTGTTAASAPTSSSTSTSSSGGSYKY
jgi:predicted lipoprotein with Yx(FWY)xxD motif